MGTDTLKAASGNELILAEDDGAAALTVEQDGNVTLETGNLIIGTAGKGIDFSQAQTPAAGMTAEILDSYETGTWSPIVSDLPSGGNTATPDAGGDIGHYTKIGNMCNATGIYHMSSDGSMTSGNVMYVQGLPFTSKNVTNMQYIGNALFYRINTTYEVTLALNANVTNFSFYQRHITTTWDLDTVSCGDIQYASTCWIAFQVTYPCE